MCSICKYNTTRKDLINRHINKKIMCKPDYFEYDPKDFPEKPSIIEIPISYSCKLCKEKFKIRSKLQKHKETCTGSKGPSVPSIQLEIPTTYSSPEQKLEKQLAEALAKIEELEKEIDILKANKHQTINSSYNTTNNINIYVMSKEKNSMENVMKTIPLLLNELNTNTNKKNTNKTYLLKDSDTIKDSLEVYDIDTDKLKNIED